MSSATVLNGTRPLQLGIQPFPPLVFPCAMQWDTFMHKMRNGANRQPGCYLGGTNAIVTFAILRTMGHPVNMVDMGRMAHGSFDPAANEPGMAAHLSAGDGVLDTTADLWLYSEDRARFVRFSHPVHVGPGAFLAKKPSKYFIDLLGDKLWTVFPPHVWLFMCSLILLMSAVLFITAVFLGADWDWWTLSCMLFDGNARDHVLSMRHELVSHNAVIIMLSVFVGLIKALYKSLILSAIVMPARKMSFDSIPQLIEKVAGGELTMATETPDSWLMVQMEAASSGVFYDIKRAVKSSGNPVQFPTTGIEAMTSEVIDKDLAYFCHHEEECIYMQISDSNCETQIIYPNGVHFPSIIQAYIFPNNSVSSSRSTRRWNGVGPPQFPLGSTYLSC